MKKLMVVAALALGLVLMSMPAMATRITSVFDSSWTMIADDDTTGVDFVNPGYGGQAFDAEYLFYKFNADKTKLSIGLQTGFDVIDGVLTENRDYYAGDLALSFDDCGDNGWEYGVDFGWYQEDYFPNDNPNPNNDLNVNGTNNDSGEVGLYRVTEWNNNVFFTASGPFAIKSGSKINAFFSTTAGSYTDSNQDTSYWRTVTFDVTKITGLPAGGIQNIAASWTMSCGNDVVRGCAPVPEPQTLLLMGIGLLGLAFVGRKKLGEKA